MCHVVSSNSYKNLPADRWTHTTGEKGPEFASERRNDTRTDFSLSNTDIFYHIADNAPKIRNESVIWGGVLTSNMDLWSDHGYSCLWITDLTNKRRYLFPEASLRLSSTESERSEDAVTSKGDFGRRRGEKKRSSVQLGVHWKVLEINRTQTVRLGQDKQKEQGGRGSLHHQPQNIS